ncbi:MAG TPA: hypothetical protein VN048_04330 [Verrucomicrobiae bacterium]|nr:hypothetical protein [Verrucomicrobiae bacterium]
MIAKLSFIMDECYIFPSGLRLVSIRLNSKSKKWDLYVDEDLIEAGFRDPWNAASAGRERDFSDEIAKRAFSNIRVSENLDADWHPCGFKELFEELERMSVAKSTPPRPPGTARSDSDEASFAD